MGSCLTCCKDDIEAEWFFSTDSLPKDIDIEAKIDWTQTPYNSPSKLSEKEIADLYRKEYENYNKYRIM